MAKFCSNCGSPLDDGAVFCGTCGTSVSAPEPAQPAPQPAQPYQPVQQPYQQPVQQPYQPVQQPAPQYHYATPVNAQSSYGGGYPYAQPDAPGASDKKSHMGLGIAVTVGVVLLIAAVIVVFVIWKPFGGSVGSSDSAQGVADKMAASYTDSISESDLLSVIYEYNFAINDDIKDTAKRYALSESEGLESAKAYYGDDVKVTATIKETETLSGSLLESAISELGYYASTDKIDEIVMAKVEMKVTGSNASDSGNRTVYFIRVGDKWYTSVTL